jgi:AraC-like DNA-binding protein
VADAKDSEKAEKRQTLTMDPLSGGRDGLRFGKISGEIQTTGWQWKVASSGSVWLWLNREGSGLVWGKSDRFYLRPGMFAMTGGDTAGEWTCMRHPGRHQLEMVVIPREWLLGRLGNSPDTLRNGLAQWIRESGQVAFCGLMGLWERDLCEALALVSPLPGPTRLRAEARVLEWAAARLFRSPGSQNDPSPAPTEHDPVKRAVQWLRERLDQNLDLAAVAREVGISPHHLSRKVSAETGLTLQRHLRRLRIERACETLDSKRMNVTEVALEVGYQSLSHFAKAFREETGRSPSDWLAGK